jgi:hypothetical protein
VAPSGTQRLIGGIPQDFTGATPKAPVAAFVFPSVPLSQAFARFFKRVGLPSSMPPSL